MIVRAIKTRPFIPPKDDLTSLLSEVFSRAKPKEKSIIVITSKIVSIGQGRCVKIEQFPDKDELVKKEADFYIGRDKVPGGYVMLTIKKNLLIPTAGIDESNAKGYFILWPDRPFKAAKDMYDFIKKTYHLKNFGVIISDSHTSPLRWGTIGVALSYYGFWPLTDYRHKKDIFGREMKITQANRADALAAAAVTVMGEGKEQTPIAVIEDIDFIKFKKFNPEKSDPLKISINADIYAPLLKAIKWKKGRGGRNRN